MRILNAHSHTGRIMPASKTRPKTAITAVDVARRAEVSIATVSRVLHHPDRVTEDVRVRVLAAIDELGYVPHTAARNLAQGKTNTLGLLLPEIGADFFSPLLRGIESAARAAGYDLLIATLHLSGAHGPLPLPLGAHNTDGLLIFSDNADPATAARLHRQRFPAVLLYRSAPPDVPIPTVAIENRAGARALVTHLILAHGRRRIGFLRGPAGNEDSAWREQGYREALAAHGLAYDPGLVDDGGFREGPSQATVARWLAEGRAFDAIFAGDDDSAGGALLALHAAGRRVPQDVALAGFDDTLISRYLTPPLTTVHAPTEQVGAEGVRQLVQLIQTGLAEPVVLLPTTLVIRQSCGCP
jgi:DNA-binding LacI/PurR family transcriptional regulator